ncbi:MAG: PilZ domain-containing protein [Oligoflexia bacterium]|nr:PilZ domain-containing protein [Oligoflexia bacterium]
MKMTTTSASTSTFTSNSNSTSEKSKPYFRALSVDEKTDMLDMLAKRRYKITLWEKGTKHLEQFNALQFDAKSILFIDMIDYQTQLLNRPVLACFTYDNTQYFTKCTLLLNKEFDYYIEFKDTLFKCEKRNTFRLNMNSNYAIKFTIDDREFEAVDASIGGVGLILDKTEKVSFREGLKFAKCTLNLNTSPYHIALCEVVHITPVPNKDKIRLGIKFAISPVEIERKLCQQINQDFINMKKRNWSGSSW